MDHDICLLRRDLPVILPVRSNADLRPLIVCTISSVKSRRAVSRSAIDGYTMTLTREFGTFRLEFIPLVPAVAEYDHAESSRGRLARLARNDGIDVVRGRLAAIEDHLSGLVRRWHDLHTRTRVVRENGGEMN